MGLWERAVAGTQIAPDGRLLGQVSSWGPDASVQETPGRLSSGDL